MEDKLSPLKPISPDNLSSQILLSLMNNMTDAVIAIDNSFNINLYNSSALNILDVNNIKPKAAISSLLSLTNNKNENVDIVKLLESTKKATSRNDYKITYKDNSYINVYLSISIIKEPYGKNNLKGYLLTLRDITREKSLDQERDEFISVVSHELRTPITVIEGNLSNIEYLINKHDSILKIKKAASDSHKQALYLSSLINDLTSLSRAENATKIDHIDKVNVVKLIEGLKSTYQSKIEEKGLKLITEIDPELSLIKSSKLYINEILENFISNAIKYTIAGHISIHARAIKNGAEFIVTDTGIGIIKSDIEKIFNKFYRSGDYQTHQSSGTGLGLYISKKLASLIGAKIEIKSEINKGTSVILVVPDLS